MKKALFLFVAALFSGSALYAQPEGSKYGEDSVKCRENLYIYYELARKKQWIEAYPSWEYVYQNCPQSSKNNFIYGPYIVEAKLKEAAKAGDAAAEAQYKQMLMDVYDNRNKYFPGKEGYVYGRKALDMVQHYPDSSKAAYDLFSQALEADGQEQSAAFYNYYFVTAARLFNADVFSVGDVFTAYNVVIEGMEFNTDILNRTINELSFKRDSNAVALDQKEEAKLGKAQRELERYQTVADNIDKILTPIATCDKLGIIYNEETFAANQNDTLWLKRAVKMLQKERKNEEGEMESCTDNPIYLKISEALYKMQPSAPAARAMYVLAVRNNDYSKAANYIKEAISYEVDPLKQANDYNRLARTYLGTRSLAAAKNAAVKASRLRKNWGDPYVTLAQVYAAADGSCGNNVFEKKAVYWAAIDKLQYARSIDPSVSAQANRLINAYRPQLPDKNVSFQLGHTEGETYTIGCFINETITVKF